MENRPLKIALIHASDFGGGAERSVLSLHLSLIGLGHKSHLYVGYKLTDFLSVSQIERAQTIPGLLSITNMFEKRFGLQNLYSPGFRRLRKIIELDTDVIHINSLWGSGNYADIGSLPALTRRFPAIITLREQWMTTGHCACPFECRRWLKGCGKCPDLDLAPRLTHDGTKINWLRKRLSIRRSNIRVTTISDWLRKTVQQSPIFEGKQVEVVYNGIDETIFSPGDKQKERDGLGLPPDKFIVLLAGQSIEGINEGIAQHAITAMNGMNEDGILALLIGKSAHLVANNLNVPSKVLPFQKDADDMARCFRAADITVICSEYEAFGRIAAESQACGTPVISFSTGGLPEVVKDGTGGIIVPTGDVTALRKAIQRLLENPAEVIRMGREGSAHAREKFSNSKIARDFVKQYREVIEERKE